MEKGSSPRLRLASGRPCRHHRPWCWRSGFLSTEARHAPRPAATNPTASPASSPFLCTAPSCTRSRITVAIPIRRAVHLVASNQHPVSRAHANQSTPQNFLSHAILPPSHRSHFNGADDKVKIKRRKDMFDLDGSRFLEYFITG